LEDRLLLLGEARRLADLTGRHDEKDTRPEAKRTHGQALLE
jgi:hypothetical protein